MKVQVLLSTYNGERFLSLLVESVFAQTHRDLGLVIRDDGSTDQTVPLLKSLAAADDRIHLVEGENTGYPSSFLCLLRDAPDDSAYTALCDQDDVWQPEKIARAVSILEGHPADEPLLYCSRVLAVSEGLAPLGLSPQPSRDLSFANCLVECVARGCTVVLNRPALDLLRQEPPREVLSHDWWLLLVVSAFGRVIFDDYAGVLYRRHSANASAFPANMFATAALKARRFCELGVRRPVARQALAFRRAYGARLPAAPRRVLDRFLDGVGEGAASWRERLRYSLTCDVYRQTVLDDLTLKALILFRRL